MSKLSEMVTKFIETKEKLSELEKKHEKYRSYIQKEMEKMEKDEIVHSIGNTPYTIKKSLMKRESLSKKDVPKHVWEECHKTVMYTVIRVSSKNKNDKNENDDKND